MKNIKQHQKHGAGPLQQNHVKKHIVKPLTKSLHLHMERLVGMHEQVMSHIQKISTLIDVVAREVKRMADQKQ